MLITRIILTALLGAACCSASAQSSVRPGTVDLDMSITGLALTPFSLAPSGGAASLGITSNSLSAEGTLHALTEQLHDSETGNSGYTFYLIDSSINGERVGVSLGREPFNNPDASAFQKLRAQALIQSPDTKWQRVEGSFNTETSLHLSANSGVTLSGRVDATQLINPVGRFSNQTFAGFVAQLIGPAGETARYEWTFGTQGGGETLPELFSLTLYNRSDSAADFIWRSEANVWATVAVPEPGGMAMTLAGFGVLGLIGRRRYRPAPLG